MSLNFVVLTATILPGFIGMREEFRVAKMAVKSELRRLTIQNV
jgi:hypothetical protein